jgi:hypothetical protein
MSSSAVESQGTVLAIDLGDSSPTVFTAIPEVRDLTFGDGAAAVIDVTDLSSTAKEKRMGLQDWGQATFTIMWLSGNSTHMELRTAKGDRQARDFKVTLSNNKVYYFTGFVLSNPLSMSVDAVVESNITIAITGDITEA